jgi:hypothetical protein
MTKKGERCKCGAMHHNTVCYTHSYARFEVVSSRRYYIGFSFKPAEYTIVNGYRKYKKYAYAKVFETQEEAMAFLSANWDLIFGHFPNKWTNYKVRKTMREQRVLRSASIESFNINIPNPLLETP